MNREASDRTPGSEIQEHPGEEERDLRHRRPGAGGEARLGAEHHRHPPEPPRGHQEVGRAGSLAPWDGPSSPALHPPAHPGTGQGRPQPRGEGGWVGGRGRSCRPCCGMELSAPRGARRAGQPRCSGLGRAQLPAPRGVTGPRHVAAQLWPFVGPAQQSDPVCPKGTWPPRSWTMR